MKPLKDQVSSTSETNQSMLAELKSLAEFFYIKDVPSYGNNFFFTIGVYLLELFGILAITGIVMLIFGPYWWNLTTVGTFFRSLHLWAAEAFVTLIFVHLFVQFATSSFKKKKLVWHGHERTSRTESVRIYGIEVCGGSRRIVKFLD